MRSHAEVKARWRTRLTTCRRSSAQLVTAERDGLHVVYSIAGADLRIYRLWRDMGEAVGALLAGIVADTFGLSAATLTIAAMTFASGVVVAVRMRETLRREAPYAARL